MDRDFHRVYEFLMRLRPEFEVVRAQLLHRVPPPPLSDTLALVIAEETRLRSLGAAPPPATGPHVVLATPQSLQSVPLLPSPGYSAPVHPAFTPRPLHRVHLVDPLFAATTVSALATSRLSVASFSGLSRLDSSSRNALLAHQLPSRHQRRHYLFLSLHSR